MTEEAPSLFWHRVKFLSLIGVFLAPFIGGWLALYVFDIRPDNINYGTLVQPVKKLDWPTMKSVDGQAFKGGFGQKWTFVLVSRNECSQLCQSNLFYMRQIRTLLGRDSHRLQNVLMLRPRLDVGLRAYLDDYPNLLIVDGFTDNALLEQFSTKDAGNTRDAIGLMPKLYLIDPDQNYMMHYPAENNEHRILEDIRKLMKLSKIG